MNLNFFVSAFFLVKGELCFKNFPPSQELPSSQKKIQNNFLLQKKSFCHKKNSLLISHTQKVHRLKSSIGLSNLNLSFEVTGQFSMVKIAFLFLSFSLLPHVL